MTGVNSRKMMRSSPHVVVILGRPGSLLSSLLSLLPALTVMIAVVMTTAGSVAAVSVNAINRHSQGDIFSLPAGDCSPASCSLATPGSAGQLEQQLNGTARLTRSCQCQCPTERPVYREDARLCVNTIEECSLADYVSGLQSEKVPFVFLPAQGQLINPNAEIALSDVRAEGQMVVSPVCVVSKAHFLTSSGWMPTDNSSSTAFSSGSSPDLMELPFALAREAGRTHLQWLGESRLRSLMEGRIVLVKLLCKDTANVRIGVFSPCIAFRVAGSPGLFDAAMIRSGSTVGEADNRKGSGLRQADYLAIGISAGLLGALYVAGLVGFLCYRRRKRQVQNVHIKLVSSPTAGDPEAAGIIRLNPLMHQQQQQQQQQQPGDGQIRQSQRHRSQQSRTAEASELRSSSRAKENKNYQDKSRRHPSSTSGGVHQAMNPRYHHGHSAMMMDERYQQQHHHDPSGVAGYFYSHPDAAAAAAAAAAMNARRIFFSPAYFDPDLLRSPPPAALEFLARIRGMIDVAKDKMSSKRFMPSLVDIPEELSAYGSSQRLSHYAEELRRNASFSSQNHDQQQSGRTNYGTLKNAGQTLLKNSLKRVPKRAGEDNGHENESNEDEDVLAEQLYPPVELRATSFLQKSPLPGRKSFDASLGGTGLAAVYTNPSIEDIYRSLDRLKAETAKSSSNSSNKSRPGKSSVNKKKAASESCDSDAVSDLVSEAESKMPKINTSGQQSNGRTAPSGKIYFEPDSLDRSTRIDCQTTYASGRSHLYQKKPQRGTTASGSGHNNLKATSPHQQPTHPLSISHQHDMEAEEANMSAGYTSSTCTSVQSLSRVLPAEEAMEVGNQLFNMHTGAPTLPRPSANASKGSPIYDLVRDSHQGMDNNKGLFVNREFRKPAQLPDSGSGNCEETSSSHSGGSSGSSSKVTVVDESYASLKSKLTIRVESTPPASVHGGGLDDEDEENAFEPDTLERGSSRNLRQQPPFRRQPSGTYLPDSLERPIRPVKSAIQQLLGGHQVGNNTTAPVSPSSGSSSSGLGSSTASQDWNVIKKEELPRPGSVVSLRQIYSRKNNHHHHHHHHNDSGRSTRQSGEESLASLKSTGSVKDDAVAVPPPLPVKLSTSKSSPAPLIPRNLKPASSGIHQHLHHSQPTSLSATGEVGTAPSLPPKNGRSGSSNGPATSASSRLGEFISQPPPPPPPPKDLSSHNNRSRNVLERIAQIEQESREAGWVSGASPSENGTVGQTKGMEIALALKARMGHLEGSLKDHKKTMSIKKTWRKLLDKVEDSFSETESAVSTLVRPHKSTKKALPAPEEEREEGEEEEEETDDDSSQSGGSLGSDGTGTQVAPSTGSNDTSAIQLKSYYTFGQEMVSKNGSSIQYPAASNKSVAKTTANSSKIYSTYQTSIGDY